MSTGSPVAAGPGGGRPAGQLLCIGGLPGSGKTTGGRPVVEVTGRLLAHRIG